MVLQNSRSIRSPSHTDHENFWEDQMMFTEGKTMGSTSALHQRSMVTPCAIASPGVYTEKILKGSKVTLWVWKLRACHEISRKTELWNHGNSWQKVETRIRINKFLTADLLMVEGQMSPLFRLTSINSWSIGDPWHVWLLNHTLSY